MRVLGIDCGTEYTGYGIVEQAKDGVLQYVSAGVIRLNTRRPLHTRLFEILQSLTELISEYRPGCVAIEDLFYAVNVKSALKLGHVRGVAMLAAAMAGLDVAEYAPLAVKSAVVGYGRAEKSQVQQMVGRLLRINSVPQPADAADALAIAICHLHTSATIARQAAAAP